MSDVTKGPEEYAAFTFKIEEEAQEEISRHRRQAVALLFDLFLDLDGLVIRASF